MSDGGNVRRRWTQARRVLRWRRFAPESQHWALDVLRGPPRPVPQCLAVITAIQGAPINSVGVAKSHWDLLHSIDPAVARTGPCVITVHDLDEDDLMLGLLAILACDEFGDITTLPPARSWSTHDA